MFYVQTMESPLGPLSLAVSEKGLVYSSLGPDPLTLEAFAKKQQESWREDSSVLEPYRQQFQEYFAGDRKNFTFPLDLRGTAYQVRVWQALGEIAYGKTCSYQDLADRVNSHPRPLGQAVGKNPLMLVVPCHRVIAKDGRLTGFRSGLEIKKSLLALEKEN